MADVPSDAPERMLCVDAINICYKAVHRLRFCSLYVDNKTQFKLLNQSDLPNLSRASLLPVTVRYLWVFIVLSGKC